VRAGLGSFIHLVKSGIKRWLILIPEGKTLRSWFRVQSGSVEGQIYSL
jgi:hypothetical protein